MAQVINTNISSLNAQRNLNTSQSALNVSLQRLSSGLRINSAKDDPDTVWVTEVWKSQADHQASLTNDAVKALITAARPYIAAPPEGFEVTPIGGKGLPDNFSE